MKQITKFMAVVLLLALGSCEKDLYDEVIQSEKQNFTVKKISLSDLSKKDNLKLFKKVDEVKSISKKVNGKIVFDSENNLYFDDENGKLVENEFGKKSYTFPIYKTSSADDKMENIVFQEIGNGEYDIYKTKYSFTEEQLKSFTSQEIEQQTITYSEISQGKISIVCVSVVVWELVYATGQGGIPTIEPPSHYEWVVKSHKCTNIADNTTDYNTGGSGVDGLGSGAGGAINTNPVENNYYYIVNPHNPDSNYLNLNPSQVSWLNSQTKETRKEIINFGFQNSDEVDFVNQCINQMIQNPGVFNSIKPFIIEKQIDDSQLDDCSKGVFQQIKNTTNCDFAQVLAKLGAGKNYNTTMISAVPPNQRPGQTIWNSPYNYTIYISTNYSDKTKLFIATTELHELVHAYFMSLFDDYNNGNPSNPNAYNDFAILFQMYVNKTYPGSGAVAHHQQMATDYVNAIASALKEFQPGLDQQIYDDLAWGSLQEAPIFDTLFPVGSSNRERIINRYTSESIGSPYGQGTPNEQTPVGQPCN
jgi:hypothetical protein